MKKERPNFVIVENYDEDIDLEAMAKDYLDPSVSIPKLCKKYGISRKKYYSLKKHLVDMTGVEYKASYWGGRGVSNFEHIYETDSGHFKITKFIDGKSYHFGQYDSLDEAVLVRDDLIAHDWDRDYYLKNIKRRYFESSGDPWKETFKKFKKDYLDGMTVSELQKKYGLSNYRYYSLSASLRKEYGLSRKPMRTDA